MFCYGAAMRLDVHHHSNKSNFVFAITSSQEKLGGSSEYNVGTYERHITAVAH